MRKIILLTAVFLSIFTFFSLRAYSFPNIYIDLQGVYLDADEADKHLGGGGGIGINIHSNFNLSYRNMFTSGIDSEGSIMLHLFGFEYFYQIGRIGLKGAFLVGPSELSVNVDDSGGSDDHESGVCFGLWLGVSFAFTQHVSPFIDFGYHKQEYSTFPDASIEGVNIYAGIRFTIGSNQRSTGEY